MMWKQIAVAGIAASAVLSVGYAFLSPNPITERMLACEETCGGYALPEREVWDTRNSARRPELCLCKQDDGSTWIIRERKDR